MLLTAFTTTHITIMIYNLTNLAIEPIVNCPNVTLSLKIIRTSAPNDARIHKESAPAVRYAALRQAYDVFDHHNATNAREHLTPNLISCEFQGNQFIMVTKALIKQALLAGAANGPVFDFSTDSGVAYRLHQAAREGASHRAR